VTGAVLCSRKDPRASGAGAAIMLQGLFCCFMTPTTPTAVGLDEPG
jgi:hypothetical protein